MEKFLDIPDATISLKCTLFEDNKGAQELAKVPKYRPRTIHIAIKYHHFREWVQKGILQIIRVDTNEQQADIFTKPLVLVKHQYLKEKIMGWCCILVYNTYNQIIYENMRLILSGW